MKLVTLSEILEGTRAGHYAVPHMNVFDLSMLHGVLAAAEEARRQGLGLNAGHDLNLENLRFFVSRIPWTDEVSIGHALICDALYYGLENTVQLYKRELR